MTTLTVMMREHRNALAGVALVGVLGAFSAVPSMVASASDEPNNSAIVGAELPDSDEPIYSPQWVIAVAYGVHVAGKASMYGAAAAAGAQAARGVNIWWAGSEPRGAEVSTGDASPEVIFDR